MNIDVKWMSDRKDTVMMDFHDKWNWNDFLTRSKDAHKLIESVDYPVNLLIVHRVAFAKGNPLIHFRNAFSDQPDNTDKVVIVVLENVPLILSFMKSLAQITERIFPQKSKLSFVNSMEDALSILDASG